MRNNPRSYWWLMGVGLVLVWSLAPALGAEGPAASAQAQVVTQSGPGVAQVQVGARPMQLAEPVRLSEYWLGLQCAPVDEALRAQLGLAEGQGLVVQEVMPDSPAAKAGLKRFDVLAAVDGKPIKGIADLVAAVDKAKDKKDVALEVIRGGEKVEVKARPAKRPAEARPKGGLVVPPGVEGMEELRKWFEKAFPEGKGWGPRLRVFGGPAIVLPPGTRLGPPLPGNLSITISKQGNEPAKIVVKRDDEKWELTEKELDKLPPDIRPHVERMLGRVPRVDFRVFGPEDRALRPLPLPKAPGVESLEKRLDQMSRQLEELRRSLRQLRERDRQEHDQPQRDRPAPQHNAPKETA